jgi:hypothetical protein
VTRVFLSVQDRMVDTWNEAVGNFTYYPDLNSSGGTFLSYVGGAGNEGNQKELALAACASQDACWGVLGVDPRDKPNAGGWSYYLLTGTKGNGGGPELGVSGSNVGNGRRTWIKKPNTRKPQEFVDGMGILPLNGDTKVKICTDTTGQQSCGLAGRGFWGRSMPNAGAANSVVVPIGYKVGLNLNVFDGTDEADSKSDGSRVGSCGNLDAGGGNKVWNKDNQDGQCFYNGWSPGNRPDGIIVSQVPINIADVNVFNGLSSAGVGLNDVKLMRAKYCSQLSTIDSNQCKLFSADPGNLFDFDVMKTNICNQDPNWSANPTCVAAVNSAQKTGSQAGKASATQMVQILCDANPTNPLCGCYNVTKHGAACIRDASLQDLPGCAGLFADFGSLPSSYGAVDADKFCASDDCITKAWSGATALLPAPRAEVTSCPPIQKCIQDFRGAQFNSSDLTASCKQTLNISTTPGAPGTTPTTTPGAPGTTPGAPGTTPGAPGTTPTTGDKKGLWPLDAIPGVNTKPKQIGMIVFLIILCCCCLMLLGIVVSSGGQ